jgi:hypothetical protein
MATPLRRPLFEDIKDERVRESIQWIYEYLIAQQILTTNFQFFSVTVTAAVTALLVPHNLGFRPKDIIVTSVTNGQTATFIYDSFTATNISLTTSGACTVRFFGGSYGT